LRIPLHPFRPRLLTERPRHDPNQELMAQGVANVVSPMFGGMPATGTIARTVTNVRAGATSPVAGMVHALTLLGVMLVAQLEDLPQRLLANTRHLVLDMQRLISMDTSRLEALRQLHRSLQRQGITLTLVDVNEQPLSLLRRSGFEAALGAAHIVDDLAALQRQQAAPRSGTGLSGPPRC
jgi:MFS superfamily sulfate permease-like transporter